MGFDVLRKLGIIDAALEDQLAIFAVDEDVRSGDRSEHAGDFLSGSVVEVGKIETLVLRADDHFVEGVTHVSVRHLVETHGRGVVGINRDHGHAFIGVVVGKIDQSLFVALRGGAVVAGEDETQQFGIGKTLWGVGFRLECGPLDSGQFELGQGRTNGLRLRRIIRGE